jgi:hypothetical protein
MRTLTLQFNLKDLAKARGESRLENIESLHVLHILEQDRNAFAFICKASFKGPSPGMEDLFQRRSDVQLLQKERDRVCTYFVKVRPHPGLIGEGGYLVAPYEVRDGEVTVTFLGDSKQAKRFLQRAKKTRIPHRVVSVRDAIFPPDSPLSHLTEKQRNVLITAFNLGYFDRPKRISTRALAEKLDIRSSTFIAHKIKAERRLLAEVLKES